jgi:hypothetical protein
MNDFRLERRIFPELQQMRGWRQSTPSSQVMGKPIHRSRSGGRLVPRRARSACLHKAGADAPGAVLIDPPAGSSPGSELAEPALFAHSPKRQICPSKIEPVGEDLGGGCRRGPNLTAASTPRCGSSAVLRNKAGTTAFCRSKPKLAGGERTGALSVGTKEQSKWRRRRILRRAVKEREKFFQATDALETKRLEFLGWRGPRQARKLINKLAR